MTDKPDNAGRNQDGTFAKGHSGNAAGNRQGSRHRTSKAVEALLDGDAEQLTRVAVARALAGDMTALRLCLERIAPPRKDRPITVQLSPVRDASDHAPAVAATFNAMARGELSPSEAQAVIAILEQHRKSLEMGELERRIRALEGK